MKKKGTLLLSLILLPLFFSMLITTPVYASPYLFVDSFESGITDVWVKEELGGTIESTSESKVGNFGINGTAFGGGVYNGFIWTDNYTSGASNHSYMGYWIKLDADLVLADTKSIYISAMWNDQATWQYIHIKNASGVLRWYPDGRDYYGDPISLGTWYKVVNGYYINPSGWERLWVNEDLIMDYARDTSGWNYTTGISVGMMQVYGTGSDGGSVYFDWVYADSDFLTITVSADLEDVDNNGADWVFTNWKYYTFTVTVPQTGLDNVSMAFTIPTSFEDVACGFFSDGDEWFYESNMSYESRYGEPVLLQAGTWEEAGGSTTVTYPIWFQEIVLDVWEPGDAIPVDISVDGGSWENGSAGLFRIYSKGGFSLNTESSNSTHAWILDGGTPFSFHVEDDGSGTEIIYMYNEIWFRDVNHLKLLPEIHFLTGYDAFDIDYGVDYSFGDGEWETGWYLHISPETVHYNGLMTQAVYINMSVFLIDRSGTVAWEDLYMYNHGSILGNGDPGWWEIWVDLWVSDKNASSVGSGRVNAYEYAMEDNADLWLRWLANNWAPMDDTYKEFQGDVPILGNDDVAIMSSERVVMWRYWSKLQVVSSAGGQEIEIRNFEHFDDTRCQELPLAGISSPVFDETITPVVGSKGLLGALFTMFAGIGSWLSENVLFGGLNLWGAFVGFLDTIAGMFGAPKFFTNLFNWIAEMLGYLANSISYMGTVLTAVFQLFTNLMGSFLTTMEDLITSLLATFTYFTDMMGGAYGVGVNLWDALGISQWIMVAMVFYPIYLIILWDQEGMDAVLKQLTWMFGILSWIFGFMVSLIQFIIGLVTAVIESIPIAE